MGSFLFDKVKKLEQSVSDAKLQEQVTVNARLAGLTVKVLPYSEYTALATKDPNILYITDAGGMYFMYKGDTQIRAAVGYDNKYACLDYGLLVDDYQTSAYSRVSGAGNSYAQYHTELYSNSTATNSTKIYDGANYSRFVPKSNATNRYIIGTVNGRCSDGRPNLTIELGRRTGPSSTRRKETLTYKLFIIRYILVHGTYGDSAIPWYGIRCSRTINGSTTSWIYTGGYTGKLYSGSGISDGQWTGQYTSGLGLPQSVVGSSYSNSIRTCMPILTLGFNANDLGYLNTTGTNAPTPYLVLTGGKERAYSNGNIKDEINSGASIKLTESSDPGMQLGINYDPDTGSEYAYPASLYTSITGNYQRAAKIAGWDQSKEVT